MGKGFPRSSFYILALIYGPSERELIMKLKKLLKTCINTVDSVCILEINNSETQMGSTIKDVYSLSDAELSAEVYKWSVEHVADNGTEADDTKIELTVYVKYDN